MFKEPLQRCRVRIALKSRLLPPHRKLGNNGLDIVGGPADHSGPGHEGSRPVGVGGAVVHRRRKQPVALSAPRRSTSAPGGPVDSGPRKPGGGAADERVRSSPLPGAGRQRSKPRTSRRACHGRAAHPCLVVKLLRGEPHSILRTGACELAARKCRPVELQPGGQLRRLSQGLGSTAVQCVIAASVSGAAGSRLACSLRALAASAVERRPRTVRQQREGPVRRRLGGPT